MVRRLRDRGVVILGKTNMDEFAMGSSTENSGFGPTRNPWDTSRVPGGSSGGSAAAVAAGQAPLGIGTDTGGSIRQPAALCGIVGVKPTYGLVSRYGLIAFASSLDQVGPLTRDVRDAADLLEAICGHDPMDSTSIPDAPADFTSRLTDGVDGLRVGVVKELFLEGTEPGVLARVREGLDRLERLGARLEECSLPSFEYALSAYYLIAPAECSSNLARYDGVRWGLRAKDSADVVDMMQRTRQAGFGAEVKRRVMLGTYALSAGTTTPTTARPRRSGPWSAASWTPPTSASTCWSGRPRRRSPSGSARRPTTRWPCTSTTCSPSRSTWPATRPCRCRRGCRTGCRWGCS